VDDSGRTITEHCIGTPSLAASGWRVARPSLTSLPQSTA
jgi:hypothetical protein